MIQYPGVFVRAPKMQMAADIKAKKKMTNRPSPMPKTVISALKKRKRRAEQEIASEIRICSDRNLRESAVHKFAIEQLGSAFPY